LNDVHVLDVKAMKWISPEVRGETSAKRDSHSVVAIGNKIVVYGGDCGDHYLGDVDILDLFTFTWSRMVVQGSNSPGVQAGHASVVIGSKVYINDYCGVSLPEEFGDLRSLKVLYLRYYLGMKSLPDSFGKLTNLQDISLLGSSLQMLPNSFGKLTRLKHLELHNCFDLTISSVTLGNITTLEYLNILDCRNVGEFPPQVSHQRSLKELWLSGANLKELPSEKKVCIVRNRCNKIRDDAQEPTPGDEDYGRWLQEILGRYHSCDDWGITIRVMMGVLPFTRCSSVVV
jgi:hypothetical protein